MAAINRAYAILSDPVKRKAYDTSLTTDYSDTGVDGFPAKAPERSGGAEATTAVETPIAPMASFDGHLFRIAAYTALAVVAAVGIIYALNNSGSDSTSDSFVPVPFDGYGYRLKRAEASLKGNGVPQNFQQAMVEFEAIADAKDLRADDRMDYRDRASQGIAQIYYDGLGVPKDIARAEEWLCRAARSGRTVGPRPALTLGKIYEEGTGGKKDLVEAYRWYNVAAGTPYDRQIILINSDEHRQLTDSAKKKTAELAARLTTEQVNRAQQSPFPPSKYFRSPNQEYRAESCPD